jgi:hypothetical protein
VVICDCRDPRTKRGTISAAISRRATPETYDLQQLEVSASAFTFGSSAAANKSQETGQRRSKAPVSRASHSLAAEAMYLPQLAQLTFLQLAGSLILDGMRAWHSAPATAARLGVDS